MSGSDDKDEDGLELENLGGNKSKLNEPGRSHRLKKKQIEDKDKKLTIKKKEKKEKKGEKEVPETKKEEKKKKDKKKQKKIEQQKKKKEKLWNNTSKSINNANKAISVAKTDKDSEENVGTQFTSNVKDLVKSQVSAVAKKALRKDEKKVLKEAGLKEAIKTSSNANPYAKAATTGLEAVGSAKDILSSKSDISSSSMKIESMIPFILGMGVLIVIGAVVMLPSALGAIFPSDSEVRKGAISSYSQNSNHNIRLADEEEQPDGRMSATELFKINDLCMRINNFFTDLNSFTPMHKITELSDRVAKQIKRNKHDEFGISHLISLYLTDKEKLKRYINDNIEPANTITDKEYNVFEVQLANKMESILPSASNVLEVIREEVKKPYKDRITQQYRQVLISEGVKEDIESELTKRLTDEVMESELKKILTDDQLNTLIAEEIEKKINETHSGEVIKVTHVVTKYPQPPSYLNSIYKLNLFYSMPWLKLFAILCFTQDINSYPTDEGYVFKQSDEILKSIYEELNTVTSKIKMADGTDVSFVFASKAKKASLLLEERMLNQMSRSYLDFQKTLDEYLDTVDSIKIKLAYFKDDFALKSLYIVPTIETPNPSPPEPGASAEYDEESSRAMYGDMTREEIVKASELSNMINDLFFKFKNHFMLYPEEEQVIENKDEKILPGATIETERLRDLLKLTSEGVKISKLKGDTETVIDVLNDYLSITNTGIADLQTEKTKITQQLSNSEGIIDKTLSNPDSILVDENTTPEQLISPSSVRIGDEIVSGVAVDEIGEVTAPTAIETIVNDIPFDDWFVSSNFYLKYMIGYRYEDEFNAYYESLRGMVARAQSPFEMPWQNSITSFYGNKNVYSVIESCKINERLAPQTPLPPTPTLPPWLVTPTPSWLITPTPTPTPPGYKPRADKVLFDGIKIDKPGGTDVYSAVAGVVMDVTSNSVTIRANDADYYDRYLYVIYENIKPTVSNGTQVENYDVVPLENEPPEATSHRYITKIGTAKSEPLVIKTGISYYSWINQYFKPDYVNPQFVLSEYTPLATRKPTPTPIPTPTAEPTPTPTIQPTSPPPTPTASLQPPKPRYDHPLALAVANIGYVAGTLLAGWAIIKFAMGLHDYESIHFQAIWQFIGAMIIVFVSAMIKGL